MKSFTNFVFKRQSLDNFVFCLHYRWTVLLLVALSSIITCRLILGDSFVCETSTYSQRLIETKCYSNDLFSFPGESTDAVLTQDYRRYQTHYSWVNLFFLVQAFSFYLPHLLWRSYESGHLRRMTADLETNGEGKKAAKLRRLAQFVSNTQGKHRQYTLFYIFCEFCNYCTSLSNTLWLVYFFDVTGVPDVVDFKIDTWSDFQSFYFPPSSFCMLRGDSRLSCLLPLNKLYMLMFLSVHAWYILLTILSGMVLVYRIALLMASLRVHRMPCTASYSDWFFLTRLRRFLDDADFDWMLEMISSEPSVEKKKLCQEDLDKSDATSPV